MRVAIIGGNLLGCATAFYMRDAAPDSQIHIFERRSCLGGNKFATIRNALVGTLATTDIASAPCFLSLLHDANIKLSAKPAPAEWALFDWNQDTYKLSRTYSPLIRFILANRFVPSLLQAFALFISLYFAYIARAERHQLASFLAIFLYSQPSVFVLFAALFLFSAIFAFGILPSTKTLHFLNYLYFTFWIRVIASITYGSESVFYLSSSISTIANHLRTIIQYDAASSCVTLGHFLSACGLAKYAKQTATSYFAEYKLHPNFLQDIVHPTLVQTYSDSNAPTDASALALLLAALSKATIPSNLRSAPTLLSAEEAHRICPALTNAAKAEVNYDTNVIQIQKVDSGWQLFGSTSNAPKISLGVFDTVVLAAVIDPANFTIDLDDGDDDLATALALTPPLNGRKANPSNINVAKYTAIVKGTIESEYARQSSPHDLATLTTVLNSINCTEIQRLESDVWRVVTGEKPTETSSVIKTLFTKVLDITHWEHTQRRYSCTAIPHLNGAQAPSFILASRLLNAACVDRVANDINIDCLSARNTASFSKEGVAAWKD